MTNLPKLHLPDPAHVPTPRRWASLGIIMMGTFMAILDISIVNVALPHMMSAMGVTRDKIEWVATAFMIASAAVMPIVGWITGRISYKTLYLGSLVIFTVGSALCAFAWNFESLVAARIIQAIGGGAIQPVGMAIVADLFEPHERGRALGIWGTGIMVAPAIGPTLGGYLTDYFSWRAIFSVNLPIGLLTLIAGIIVMRGRTIGRKMKFDFWGFSFLTIALVAGLTGLSNGQEKGWGSDYIRACFALSAIGTILFIAVELTIENPLLDLRLFRIRNYTLSIVLAVFRAIALFGGVFLLPLFLESLVGYTTIQTGEWMIAGAVGVGITMPISGRLADRYRPAVLVTFGSLCAGVSLLWYGYLDPQSSWQMIIFPQLLRGVGLAFMMAPLLTAALNSVPKFELPMAASFLNVAQNVGGSFGIAVLNNYVTNSLHRHAVRMGEMFPAQSQEFNRFMQESAQITVYRLHGALATTQLKSSFAAGQELFRRAQVLGFENGFVFAGLVLIAAVPLCLLLKATARQGQSAPVVGGD
jgi:EmrB/QacA subfamily drug resistance transporter